MTSSAIKGLRRNFYGLLRYAPTAAMEKLRLLFYKSIGVKVGKNVQIRIGSIIDVWQEGVPGAIGDNVSIGENTVISGGVEIGTNTWINSNVSIIASPPSKILIGENCLIAQNVVIRSDDHRFDDVSRPIREQGRVGADIRIEKDCWLGANVVVLKGVHLGPRVGWNIITVDMNPDAIALKIRSQSVSDATLGCIQFRKGVSIRTRDIRNYYERELSFIGRVPFAEAAKAAQAFVETSMDARKALRVASALGLDEFSAGRVVDTILKSTRLPADLISVFRTPRDEFEFYADGGEPLQGCMQDIMETENIDAVFLDSGEFSSLPEWEIVDQRLRPGGYVILHDIFFPKSFKNWLVCGAIAADPVYETLYIDRSTPQGLMVAQKKR